MCLIPLNRTLKHDRDGKFYVICVLPQSKIIKRQSGHLRSYDRFADLHSLPLPRPDSWHRSPAFLRATPLPGTTCDVGLLTLYLCRLIYGPVIPMIENSLEIRTKAFSSVSAASDTVPLVGMAGCLSHPPLAVRCPSAGPFGRQECCMPTTSPGTAPGGSVTAQHSVLTAGRLSSGNLST